MEHRSIGLNEAIGLNGADFSPQQTMQRPQNELHTRWIFKSDKQRWGLLALSRAHTNQLKSHAFPTASPLNHAVNG